MPEQPTVIITYADNEIDRVLMFDDVKLAREWIGWLDDQGESWVITVAEKITELPEGYQPRLF